MPSLRERTQRRRCSIVPCACCKFAGRHDSTGWASCAPLFSQRGPGVEQPLKDRSILVVEDDIVLATDLVAQLTEAGCKAVLPTTSVASALSTIVRYVVDGAILDVNIQNEWVFPVAHALERAHIPFVFLTAYAPDSIPAEHRGKPFLQKPHVPAELLATI